MSIPLALGFAPGYQGPLDARDVVADITARNAIPPIQRYLGMPVHVVDSDGAGTAMNYQLVGGILDANWIEFAGGGSGGSGGMEDNNQSGPSEVLVLPVMKFVKLKGNGGTPLDAVEGIDPGEHGQEAVLINYGVNTVILKHEAATSGSNLLNGYALADIGLTTYSAAQYVYDADINYWVLVGLQNFEAPPTYTYIGNSDVSADNSWRMSVNAVTFKLEMEKRVSGVWTLCAQFNDT